MPSFGAISEHSISSVTVEATVSISTSIDVLVQKSLSSSISIDALLGRAYTKTRSLDDDVTPPLDGSGRYFQCILNATGAAEVTSEAERGYILYTFRPRMIIF